jgi:hypothetical protein
MAEHLEQASACYRNFWVEVRKFDRNRLEIPSDLWVKFNDFIHEALERMGTMDSCHSDITEKTVLPLNQIFDNYPGLFEEAAQNEILRPILVEMRWCVFLFRKQIRAYLESLSKNFNCKSSKMVEIRVRRRIFTILAKGSEIGDSPELLDGLTKIVFLLIPSVPPGYSIKSTRQIGRLLTDLLHQLDSGLQGFLYSPNERFGFTSREMNTALDELETLIG